VLYVGRAGNLRKRLTAHLDNPDKTGATANGRAVWFFWIETAEIAKVERTWMNICLAQEGRLPVLNGLYAPVLT
jgi:hypothetical protein